MKPRACRVTVAVCSLVVLAACSTARRGEPVTGRTVGSSFSRGEQLFDEHCHKCHTGGEGALAPGINDKPLPRFLMRFQVRHGLGAMPAFGENQISDDELDELLTYLHELRQLKRWPPPGV